MEYQQLLNVILGVAMSVIGWFARELWAAVKELKAGKIEFKADKQNGISVSVGRISFEAEKLVENIKVFVSALKSCRPSSVKGEFIKTAAASTTMSPGLRISL